VAAGSSEGSRIYLSSHQFVHLVPPYNPPRLGCESLPGNRSNSLSVVQPTKRTNGDPPPVCTTTGDPPPLPAGKYSTLISIAGLKGLTGTPNRIEVSLERPPK
jgi:hypothetical protein